MFREKVCVCVWFEDGELNNRLRPNSRLYAQTFSQSRRPVNDKHDAVTYIWQVILHATCLTSHWHSSLYSSRICGDGSFLPLVRAVHLLTLLFHQSASRNQWVCLRHYDRQEVRICIALLFNDYLSARGERSSTPGKINWLTWLT